MLVQGLLSHKLFRGYRDDVAYMEDGIENALDIRKCGCKY